MDLTALFLNLEIVGRRPDPYLQVYNEGLDRTTSQARPIRQVDRLNEQKILELVAAYIAGSTVSELVRQYSIHETTVRTHLKRSGVELRTYRKMSPADINRARVLRASGESFAVLASRFGVTASTIRKVLAEYDGS